MRVVEKMNAQAGRHDLVRVQITPRIVGFGCAIASGLRKNRMATRPRAIVAIT
jgi:hypothetical protein